MHIAGRPQIKTRYYEATYRTAHHGGSGEQLPAMAEAWVETRDGAHTNVCLHASDYPNLTPEQLQAKARAMLAR